MPFFSSLHMFTLMLMVTMGGLNQCTANPVNRITNKELIEEDLPIELKDGRVLVDDNGKKVDTYNGTVNLEVEEMEKREEKKASWETARYIQRF